MANLWRSANYFEHFYYAIAALSVVLMLILAAMVILGLDKTTQRIETSRGSAVRNVRLLSFPTFNAYLLGLGWGGILCMNLGLHLIVVILLSNGLGFVLMGLVYFLLMSISGLHETTRADYNMALGEIAEVYATIPANRTGRGRIRVTIDSEPRILNAETRSSAAFKPGEQVRVVERIAESVFLVKEM